MIFPLGVLLASIVLGSTGGRRPSICLLVAEDFGADRARAYDILLGGDGLERSAPPSAGLAKRLGLLSFETAAFVRDLPRDRFGGWFEHYFERPESSPADWLRKNRKDWPVFLFVNGTEASMKGVRESLPDDVVVIQAALPGAGRKRGLFGESLHAPLIVSGAGSEGLREVRTLGELHLAVLRLAGWPVTLPKRAGVSFAAGVDTYAVYRGTESLIWSRSEGLEYFDGFEQASNRVAQKPEAAAELMRLLLAHLEEEGLMRRGSSRPRPHRDAVEALKRMGYLAQ